MAIVVTSNPERSWGDVFDVLDRVVTDVNAEAYAGLTQAANVPQLTGGESPTEAEFNSLLTALKAAGLMVADA